MSSESNELLLLFDVKNDCEGGFMLVNWMLNFCLLIKGIIHVLNIPRWQKAKSIKPNKLYCIHTNCIIVLLG